MSLKIQATVTKLEKLPPYGSPMVGIRIVGETEDGSGTVTIPLLFEFRLAPPEIGDTIRVEATWEPRDG